MRLRSGSPMGNRFVVDSGGGLLALGHLGYGIIPASGSGERMMWHPNKAAFRAGGVDQSGHWDDASVGYYSWAGGVNTRASGGGAFAFGGGATASGQYAIAIGNGVVASGNTSVALGGGAKCGGTRCFALGLYANASGADAIAIGARTTADADNSLALGYRSSVNGKTGAIVISDASVHDSLEATANNQFSVRAAGGYRLFTNANQTAGVTLAAGGSSWNVVSDRNRKQDLADVDGEQVLAALRGVRVSTWRYRDEADRTVRHIGPMAQDWHRAFRLNGDSRTINMSDFDGVNLAAVRALEARTAELRAKAAEVGALRRELAELRAAQAATQARVARIEAALAR
jgi:hypothetical protein